MVVSEIKNTFLRRSFIMLIYVPIILIAVTGHVVIEAWKAFIEGLRVMHQAACDAWYGEP